ncbi:MAG: saccharopine dehydrogenase family protein [Steroidobacteraceae bacterium]
MKNYDVVVFGATSFVGQILVRYLFERHGVGGSMRWALAARSRDKLESLRRALGESARELPLIEANAADPVSLQRLCDSARVVVSTVGPYALYGEPLVAACAERGTDYCDLTGEVQWIRRMIDRYQARAQSSGARLVPSCGFDSIPSDLGVYVLQQAAVHRFGKSCGEIKMRVKAMRGGFSGGTAASLLNVAKEAAANPALRRELANPYSICPPSEGVRQPRVSGAGFDPEFGSWRAPFVMAGINTRIVHRSNALMGHPYGQEFRYSEAVMTGRGWRGRLAATGTSVGLAGFMLASAIGPTRHLLERFVLPAPGEGPSPEAQRRGFFDLRFVGLTEDGRRLRAKVTGDRDPGYGSTAKMLGEAAACLAFDLPQTAGGGGFWTPASLFRERLVTRLQRYAGLAFEVQEDVERR